MSERIGQIGNVWLSKRPGSDQWCRTWFDAATRQTRRASLGTEHLEEAKLKLWGWYAKYGRVDKSPASETAFELVLTRYYQQHAADLPSEEMARIALGYWSDFFPASAVADVTPQRQREFVAWLKSRRTPPLSDGYIKRILNVAKAALQRAWREGEIETVPFIIPGNDSPARERVLSPAESAALWMAADYPHERMFLALAYCTLARPETTLDLRRDMVDLDRGLVNLNPQGRLQTKKYRPTVPLCAALRPWVESAPEGPLVRWNGKAIDSFKTSFRRMRARACLGADVVPKTIRHTMATELRAAGVPDAEIQGMLGHKAYSGRTEVYAKYQPGYLGQAVGVIDRYMERLRVSCVLVTDQCSEET